MANEQNETIEMLNKRIGELEKRESDRQVIRQKVKGFFGALRSKRFAGIVAVGISFGAVVYLYAAGPASLAVFSREPPSVLPRSSPI